MNWDFYKLMNPNDHESVFFRQSSRNQVVVFFSPELASLNGSEDADSFTSFTQEGCQYFGIYSNIGKLHSFINPYAIEHSDQELSPGSTSIFLSDGEKKS